MAASYTANTGERAKRANGVYLREQRGSLAVFLVLPLICNLWMYPVLLSLSGTSASLRESSSLGLRGVTPGQKPPGVPGFLRKNISAPITPEPSAGLFTLAWLPDSFTDVTYRHTGTLIQRGKRSRSTGRGEEEEEEEWSEEDRRRVTRVEARTKGTG
ncbi:hypothetical protein EYF80_029058 [Liparis tanakae]|uniref:Uncharacterized protein n=1 Tax=Liparis tanakae TaxID=230148 RepID=A0A4Z2H7A9_9TELE|nr:hypothetical protein EYF80_029058 [Liparis tanakae]